MRTENAGDNPVRGEDKMAGNNCVEDLGSSLGYADSKGFNMSLGDVGNPDELQRTRSQFRGMNTTTRLYAIESIGIFFRNKESLDRFQEKLPFMKSEYISYLFDIVTDLKAPFWPRCGLCGKPIQTESESEEIWVGPINADGGQEGYVHKGNGKCLTGNG